MVWEDGGVVWCCVGVVWEDGSTGEGVFYGVGMVEE